MRKWASAWPRVWRFVADAVADVGDDRTGFFRRLEEGFARPPEVDFLGVSFGFRAAGFGFWADDLSTRGIPTPSICNPQAGSIGRYENLCTRNNVVETRPIAPDVMHRSRAVGTVSTDDIAPFVGRNMACPLSLDTYNTQVNGNAVASNRGDKRC